MNIEIIALQNEIEELNKENKADLNQLNIEIIELQNGIEDNNQINTEINTFLETINGLNKVYED